MLGAAAAYLLGVQDGIRFDHLTLLQQIGLGLAGGAAALVINFILHTILKTAMGRRYLDPFERHGRAVLGRMRWPHYILGGLMAALAEEPLFRGALMGAFDHPALGVAIAALAFGALHWMSPKFFPFWLWAVWEGVFLGILMVATGSVLVPMIAHGLHDVAAYKAFEVLLREGAKSSGRVRRLSPRPPGRRPG